MLAQKITTHIEDGLARLLEQYKRIPAQFVLNLQSLAPFTGVGTFTQFFTATPGGTPVGFGYGNLVGIGQAFQVTTVTNLGRVRVPFSVLGSVSSGQVSAFLYYDNVSGQYPSPSIYATPVGGPVAQAVEIFDPAAIAADWVAQGSTGYVDIDFTFNYFLQPGYYWIVLWGNYPSDAKNCLRIGLSHTAGLATANGFNAGNDVTSFFGPQGFTGSAQLALTLFSASFSQPPISGSLRVSILGALLAVFSDQIQLLENAGFDVDSGRQLFNGTTYPAVGAQLDGLGSLVGIPRNGLNDLEYLLFILGTIGENFSDGTIDNMTTIISLLFQVSAFTFYEFFPAEVDVQIPATAGLPPELYNLAINIVKGSKPAGVKIGFASSVPDNPFMFTYIGGPQMGGGFGDMGSPSAGGGFSSNFYNDP